MYPFSPHSMPRTAQYSTISNEVKLKQKYTPSSSRQNFYSTNYTNFSGAQTMASEYSERGIFSANTPYNNTNSRQYFSQSQGPASQTQSLMNPSLELGTPSLADQLFRVRKERKNNDTNLNLINNRIHQLKLEQKNTIKSAQMTQQKTNELIATKQQHMNRKNVMKQFKERQEEELERRRELNRKNKYIYLHNRKVMSEKKQQKQLLEYDFYRQQKEKQREEQMDMINQFDQKNHQSFLNVKDGERQKREKLTIFQLEKNRQAAMQYQKRIEQEMLRNDFNQRQIQQKEQYEQELMRRLKLTQNIRDSAVNQMQKVQKTSSEALQKQDLSQKQINPSSLQFRADTNSYFVDIENPGSPLQHNFTEGSENQQITQGDLKANNNQLQKQQQKQFQTPL